MIRPARIRSPKILLPVLLAFAVGGAVVWSQLQGAQDRRDKQRRADIAQLRDTLTQYQSTNKKLPVPEGTLKQSGQTGGLQALATAALPKPPRAQDTYVYSVTADGRLYVACSQLERNNLAVFVTATGTFDAPANACTPDTKAEIAQFVIVDGLTKIGTILFYQSSPDIVNKQTLQQACAKSTDEGQLLGCFNGKILILRLDQPEITPEMNVTAAHELMHAVWAHLPDKERKDLGTEIAAEAKRINDPELTKHLEGYDPSERTEELHSVLGTEYPNLSAKLEAHYRQYFSREAALASHAKYKGLLDALKREIDQLRAQIDELDHQANFRLAAGDIVGYNALVNPFNALVVRVNQQIDTYNALTEHTRPENVQQPVKGR